MVHPLSERLQGQAFIILHRNYGGMPHGTLHIPLKLPGFLIQCLLCIRSEQAHSSFAGFIAVWESYLKPSICPDTIRSPWAPRRWHVTKNNIQHHFTLLHSHPFSLTPNFSSASKHPLPTKQGLVFTDNGEFDMLTITIFPAFLIPSSLTPRIPLSSTLSCFIPYPHHPSYQATTAYSLLAAYVLITDILQ